MGDYSGLSAGVRVITGSDDHRGGGLTNPCIPAEFRKVTRKAVVIGKHALIFTGAVICPGVEIGRGAVVAAGTVVRHNLAPWKVYAGADCRVIKERPSAKVMELETQMIAKYGY
jgi:galactoside O-acetyltransferase